MVGDPPGREVLRDLRRELQERQDHLDRGQERRHASNTRLEGQ